MNITTLQLLFRYLMNSEQFRCFNFEVSLLQDTK